MKSGEVLSGSVETDGGRNLDVVLIGDDGLVYNLASYLKREGGKASFGLKLELRPAAQPRPQTVLALVSQAPLPGSVGPQPHTGERFLRQSEAGYRPAGRHARARHEVFPSGVRERSILIETSGL